MSQAVSPTTAKSLATAGKSMGRAAKKGRPRFVCRACGHVSARWEGRCAECNEWDSYAESSSAPMAGPAPDAPIRLADVTTGGAQRFSCRIDELDRVLGGGLVVGSVVLLGGEPGIGKSTLVLQALAAARETAGRALLITVVVSPDIEAR